MKGLILCTALLALSGGLAEAAGSIEFKNDNTDRKWTCGWSGETETEIIKKDESQSYELEGAMETSCTSFDVDKLKLSCPTVNTNTDTTITIRQKDDKDTVDSYSCKAN